jgi:hypothetical protein
MRRHHRGALILLACALSWACKKEAPAEAPTEPQTIAGGALVEMAKEAEGTASRIRGIATNEPVKSEPTSKDAVLSYVVQRIEDTGARAQLRATEQMLKAMGALDPDLDLVAVVKDFVREQVAGYYDWEKKTLYVADWIPAFLQMPTLVHEVTHALQDQKFGLARFMEPLDGFSEPQAAIQALIEGDATLVMMDSMLPSGLSGPELDRMRATVLSTLTDQIAAMPGLEGVPPVVAETFLFPYVAGLDLAARARARGGYAAIDALYASPPISTEQVLHPEKLLGEERDHPREITVKLEGEALSGYRVTGTDILGELGAKLVLKQSIPKDEAARAAAGWDGDRFLVLEKDGGLPGLLLASVWDTPEDAEEAAAALRRTKRAPVALERKETLVIGVWGPVPEELAKGLIAAAIRTMSMEEVHSFDDYRKKAGK